MHYTNLAQFTLLYYFSLKFLCCGCFLGDSSVCLDFGLPLRERMCGTTSRQVMAGYRQGKKCPNSAWIRALAVNRNSEEWSEGRICFLVPPQTQITQLWLEFFRDLSLSLRTFRMFRSTWSRWLPKLYFWRYTWLHGLHATTLVPGRRITFFSPSPQQQQTLQQLTADSLLFTAACLHVKRKTDDQQLSKRGGTNTNTHTSTTILVRGRNAEKEEKMKSSSFYSLSSALFFLLLLFAACFVVWTILALFF